MHKFASWEIMMETIALKFLLKDLTYRLIFLEKGGTAKLRRNTGEKRHSLAEATMLLFDGRK